MDRKLKLNDGTILEDSYVLQAGDTLWWYIYCEITFENAFALLSNSELVKKVIATQYGEETTYRGFKELFVIRKEDGGYITAGTRK